MMIRTIVRHSAAAALVAGCAGMAVAAKYNPAPLGAPTRVTDAANAAGTVSFTKSATKLYGTGGTYNNVKVWAPIILDRTDGFFNNAAAEMLGGAPKAINTTFDDVFVNPPRTTPEEEKLFNHWGLALFNMIAVGTPTGNDVLIDESIVAAEIAMNPAVSYNVNHLDWSNSMGALMTDGTALWRANFNSARSPSQNNVEFRNIAGALPAAASSGTKVFTAINGIDASGAGSSFISPPSGVRLNNGNLLVGQVVFGSGAAKIGTMAVVHNNVAAVSWTTPPYRWPVEQYPLITDINGAYPTDANLRTSNHRMSKLSRAGCSAETTYITFGEGSSTAPAGSPPPNNHLFTGSGFGPKVIFVDTVDTGVAQNLNGFTNGFAFICADAGATYTPGTVGGRGQIGPISNNYRFIEIQGTGSNGFAMHDINAKGQVACLWADFTNTLAPIYEVRRYDPIFDTVDPCKIVGYGAPKVIATNGVNYGGTTFVTANDSFLSGGPCPTAVTLGTSLDAPFSGVGIDDEGNVSFVGVTESFEVMVTYVDCNNIPLGTVPDVRSTTQSLCFHEAATDSLYRLVDGGQTGNVLTGTGPSYMIGRMPVSNNDSDGYGAEGFSDTGRVFALTVRSGTDEGNTDSNADGFQQDGGTLNPGLANETAARATILVELGAQTPTCACTLDLNGDCVVNTVDLTNFLGQFGKTCAQVAPAKCADSNGDGLVNTVDLTAFLGQFGKNGNVNPGVCQ